MSSLSKKSKNVSSLIAFQIFISLIWIIPSYAEPSCLQAEKHTGSIKSVSDYFEIELNDGQTLTFANLDFSFHKNAKFLRKWLIGKDITYQASGRAKDRYNRFIAQIFMDDGGQQIWLQQRLLEKGKALLYALPTVRDCFYPLLKYEKSARQNNKGLWSQTSVFKIVSAENLKYLSKQPQGTFHIIEGKVIDIGFSSKNVFINFSNDWHRDFTVLVEQRLLKRKQLTWPKMKTLKNKRIRVRGWLDHWNGPMLRIFTPEMLEIL